MPGLLKLTSSGATSSQDSSSDLGHEDGPIVDDYPAASFPGYSEKPLSENLEPIAVIGMGESCCFFRGRNERFVEVPLLSTSF
jgi:hypothetical protein